MGLAVIPRRLILSIDAILRRLYGIREFSDNPNCIFRLAHVTSWREVTLSDGTCIQPREPIGEIHFWNEHLPPFPEQGVDLTWGMTFNRRIQQSLREMAAYIDSHPEWDEARAFFATPPFGGVKRGEQLYRGIRHFGFDMFNFPLGSSLPARFATFWERVYLFALIWAFNSASLQYKDFNIIRRVEIWISREKLMHKYLVADE